MLILGSSSWHLAKKFTRQPGARRVAARVAARAAGGPSVQQFKTVAPGVRRVWRRDDDVSFRARISVGGTSVALGTFATEAEASAVYEARRLERDTAVPAATPAETPPG